MLSHIVPQHPMNVPQKQPLGVMNPGTGRVPSPNDGAQFLYHPPQMAQMPQPYQPQPQQYQPPKLQQLQPNRELMAQLLRKRSFV
jgi:hypothetical protein